MEYLQTWNEAKQAIERANSIDELSCIVNQSEALKYALKQAKEGIEVINMASEIRLRAERKAGGLLKQIPDARGNQYQNARSKPLTVQTLKQLDITKNQSSQWQKVAAIPDETFEKRIIEITSQNQELTRNKILNNSIEKAEIRHNDKIETIYFDYDDPVSSMLGNLIETAKRYKKQGRLNDIIEFMEISLKSRETKPKSEPIKSNTIFINNDDPNEASLKTVLDMGINYMRSGKTLDNFLTFLKHYIINYQKPKQEPIKSNTTVVHRKKEAFDVYIGRPSKWGNPYTHKQDGKTLAKFIVGSRDEAIEAYREYITNGEGKHLLNDLHELKGKVLGCWCKPESCHGDILAELVNNLETL